MTLTDSELSTERKAFDDYIKHRYWLERHNFFIADRDEEWRGWLARAELEKVNKK